MNKKNIPIIVLYVFACATMFYAIWALIEIADTISQLKAAGQLIVSGNEFDIASFIMSSSGQYIIFSLLLAAAGLFLQKIQPLFNIARSASKAAGRLTKEALDSNDDELDEWFNEVSEPGDD